MTTEPAAHRYPVSPFIAGLPKTELHLHLVGSASVDTVLRLARRHPDSPVPTERDALAEFYRFTDFNHFLRIYRMVDGLVRTPADVRVLLDGLVTDAIAANVRYAEVTVTAWSHVDKGMSSGELAESMSAARAAARTNGVLLNWIIDIPAGLGDGVIQPTMDFVLHERPEGTVALGLAGQEDGHPRARYRPQFDQLDGTGLHRVVHAGETSGPDEVRSALRDLGAERIGHGIGSATDPDLLAHLAAHRIPLEVCPVSNLCTKAVGRASEHPLPTLLAAGVPVTLSTDDPGMFDTDLNNEYALAATEFGLTDAELAALARTGFESAYCDEADRARLLSELDTYTANTGA